MILLLPLLILMSFNANALEIDDKLTLRVLKTSESKKTILINRGIEDGVQKGDHAKFFLSVGVVARGVSIKVSPTRSVWSLYRLVYPDYIANDQVMNLKATREVKITEDPTKVITKVDAPVNLSNSDPRDIGIPLAEGADDVDLSSEMNQTSQIAMPVEAGDIRSKKLELALGVNLTNLTSTSLSNQNDQFNSATNATSITGLGEYYFGRDNALLSRISLFGGFAVWQRATLAYQGSTVTEQSNEVSVGANYSLSRFNDKTRSFLPYLSVSYVFGTVTSEYIAGSAGSSADNRSNSGTYLAWNLGGGLKYYLGNGFGLRAHLDYRNQVDTFNQDSDGVNWQLRRTGLLGNLAISYRF
jgi:hypothetical protein